MIRARQPVAMPRFVFVQAALIGFSMILLLAVAGRLLDRWARADIRAEAAAAGHFIHVYVDRQTRRPVELPEALRAALQPLSVCA